MLFLSILKIIDFGFAKKKRGNYNNIEIQHDYKNHLFDPNDFFPSILNRRNMILPCIFHATFRIRYHLQDMKMIFKIFVICTFKYHSLEENLKKKKTEENGKKLAENLKTN